MCDFLATPAAADAPIVTPIVGTVLVSVIAGITPSSMDTAVAAAVRVVMVVVNVEGFKSKDVFGIRFGEVGNRRSVVL